MEMNHFNLGYRLITLLVLVIDSLNCMIRIVFEMYFYTSPLKPYAVGKRYMMKW